MSSYDPRHIRLVVLPCIVRFDAKTVDKEQCKVKVFGRIKCSTYLLLVVKWPKHCFALSVVGYRPCKLRDPPVFYLSTFKASFELCKGEYLDQPLKCAWSPPV